jgi:excisionase family DNA binding protein
MEDKLLLKISDVCERLSLRRSFVYRLIQQQTLPSVRVGGARRVIARDLEDFVARLKGDGESDGDQ